MRRSLFIVLGLACASATIFLLSSSLARRLCAQHLGAPGDDLAWLRQEFQLGDAELQRIRQLHEGYLPKCGEMCARIAAKKKELESALKNSPTLAPEAEQKVAEIAALRAQCQVLMLRHFQEVSQAMPPAQGKRYLAEMQRLTLGFHEQFERRMAPDQPAPHGHH